MRPYLQRGSVAAGYLGIAKHVVGLTYVFRDGHVLVQFVSVIRRASSSYPPSMQEDTAHGPAGGAVSRSPRSVATGILM